MEWSPLGEQVKSGVEVESAGFPVVDELGLEGNPGLASGGPHPRTMS
jgi:hypothetical protein